MPQVTYTSVFGLSNSMCTHSFLGSSRIAYVDSKLQPFTTIRHNECKLPNPAANVRHTATRFMPWQNKPTKPYQLSISTACWKSPKALCSTACTMLQRNSRQGLLKSVREGPHKWVKDLSKIMQKNVSQIGKKYPAESFPHLFWEHQIKATWDACEVRLGVWQAHWWWKVHCIWLWLYLFAGALRGFTNIGDTCWSLSTLLMI